VAFILICYPDQYRGRILAANPNPVFERLGQVKERLRSSTWETRVAAAQAIGAIASRIPHPTVDDLLPDGTGSGKAHPTRAPMLLLLPVPGNRDDARPSVHSSSSVNASKLVD